MKHGKIQLKRDKYRKARGGYARLISLSCAKCGTHVCMYQKDGPGPLIRLYFDRITAPGNLGRVSELKFSKVPRLLCSSCTRVQAIPLIYKKEKRLAYYLLQDAVVKKVREII